MNKQQTPWLIAWTLIILSNFSLVVQARILSVQGNNSPSQLGLTSNASSQVTWLVVEEPNAIGRSQISSLEGVFFGPQQETILGRSSQLLTQTRALIGEMNTTFTFQESLIIPQSVLRNAQDMGFNQIVYVRTFRNNPGESVVSNSVTFSLSASGSLSSVSVRQVQLEFDNGRVSAILATNSQLKGNAIISYDGSGLIQYRWEVASPSTTNGQPIFVPMMTRREYLMSTGQTTIKSPNLPTTIAGSYLLRLNIIQPQIQFQAQQLEQFQMPILRYFIRSDSEINTDAEVQKITTTLPAENTTLSFATEFVWNPVEGAKAYQVEFYARPFKQALIKTNQQNKPLTGVIVPASQTRLTMGQVSASHLHNGSTYFWRVIALSDNGQRIGESEFKSINY